MKTLCLLFAVLATLANAQTPASAPPPAGACYTLSYTKNLKGDYKKLLKAGCEREIREAKQLAPTSIVAPTPVVPGPIGVATANVAVTTVTYRDNTGKALEGSGGWAKLELAKIKAEENVAKAEAKASQPQGCGWLGCYTPVVYGYTGGYYYGGGGYYGGGAYGTNQWYGTGGGGHGRRH
ncbi:MAG: hypothetical protein AAB902_02310 [Patescibacteria group bacterium]